MQRSLAILGALSGLAQASPVLPALPVPVPALPIPALPALPAVPGLPALPVPGLSPASFDLSKSYKDEVLYNGVAGASVELGLALPEAVVKGSVDIKISPTFLLDSIIRIDLSDIEANVKVAVKAGAAITESVELCASAKLAVDVPGLLDLDIGAAFALDLLIQISAAVELTAGAYVKFGKGSYVDINVVTKEIVSSKLDDLTSSALPIAVGVDVDLSAEIEVKLGLRLRAEIGLDAKATLPGLQVGAGVDVCLWISLFDYTSVVIGGKKDKCAVAVKEHLSFSLGIAVKADVDVSGALDLSLAPSAVVTLAATIKKELCIPSLGGLPHVPGLPGYGKCKGPKCKDHDKEDEKDDDKDAEEGKCYGKDCVTKTVTETKTYSITSCAAHVPHCPASHTQKVVTSTVLTTTTVCPATETEKPTKPSPPAEVPKPTGEATPVKPCEPTTSTYAPTKEYEHPEPTITITDSTTTTVCTETVAPTPAKPSKPEAPEKEEKASPSKPSAKPVKPCPTCKPVTAGAGRAVACLGAAAVPALFALL